MAAVPFLLFEISARGVGRSLILSLVLAFSLPRLCQAGQKGRGLLGPLGSGQMTADSQGEAQLSFLASEPCFTWWTSKVWMKVSEERGLRLQSFGIPWACSGDLRPRPAGPRVTWAGREWGSGLKRKPRVERRLWSDKEVTTGRRGKASTAPFPPRLPELSSGPQEQETIAKCQKRGGSCGKPVGSGPKRQPGEGWARAVGQTL